MVVKAVWRDIWLSWTMVEIKRIPSEGFESVTTKDVDSREVWWKRNTKQNSDDRQIGKNGAHFTNQSTEKKCHFCDETDDHIATVGPRRTEIIQYFAYNKFVEMDTKGKVSRAQMKRILFSMFIPWSTTEHRQTQWSEMPEKFHLQKCIRWQISNQKACHGMSQAQRNYRKWTASFRVQEKMHYEATEISSIFKRPEIKISHESTT